MQLTGAREEKGDNLDFYLAAGAIVSDCGIVPPGGRRRKTVKIFRGEGVKRFIREVVFALSFVFAGHLAFAASSEVGVVLMHGKWGAPQSMASLASELGSRGYLVSNAEMPWSGRRLYDVDYAGALKEIEQQVHDLRSKAAKRIVVAGQSMGANAAVAYASSGFPLDALVILSPGHFPELGMGKRLRGSIEKAMSMVAANRGSELDTFDDLNQGKQRSLKMAAATYVSYFDPDGLGAMTKNIRKIPQPVPVFMAIGKTDPFFSESKALFDSAPAHTASRYVALDTDHSSMPKVVGAELIKWLDSLER
jgi:esterase/lipase